MINLLERKITKISSLVAVLSIIILIPSCTYWHKVYLKYIIPEGYEGMIVIAWDQKNGSPKTMEGDYEVYTIPANGFLRSQISARSMDVINEKFYSYNKKTGKKTELEMIDPSIRIDTIPITKNNQYYIVGLLTGGYDGSSNMVFFITKDKKSKFMDRAYREKYMLQQEAILYKKTNLITAPDEN